jgi:hypothetical protein
MNTLKTIGPVRKMSWESITEPFRSISNPSWEEVEAHIRQLETAESGSVFLNAANGSTLSIGGDRGNGYIVFASDKNVDRYLQASNLSRKGTCELVIGFQPGEYPRRIIVDLPATLSAARRYFDQGHIEETDGWTVDGKTVET